MSEKAEPVAQTLPQGVMLNAYPDSMGEKLCDIVDFLRRPELRDAFSMFYILPTFFHSDLDRGFSIIDYDRNEELVSPEDIAALDELGIRIKLDLVLNHLSVRSPQFIDLLEKGKESKYRDFFIDWNAFWEGYGQKRDISDPARIRQIFYLLYELQKYIVIRHGRSHDPVEAKRYKRQVMEMVQKYL